MINKSDRDRKRRFCINFRMWAIRLAFMECHHWPFETCKITLILGIVFYPDFRTFPGHKKIWGLWKKQGKRYFKYDGCR